jgi:surfactin synthase thioesterase subunit/acyl carrier protein
MEKQMKEVWERNLSRSPIELDQDYFEMGGDSLSAVNLLLAIEKQFGIRLKPQVLLESSTISELVREVESCTSAAKPRQDVVKTSLVSLQNSGNKTPLILIPGGSGEGFLSYKNFAQSFFPDHPVHAVQSPYAMIEDSADPVASLSTLFARQIVSLVKDRPFVLFGHCVGGLLAWHVACALGREKTPPFKLVLYDSPIPQKGINVTHLSRESVGQSRFQRAVHAYRLAWNDWRIRYDDSWQTKIGFLFWALNNVSMRKGFDRSETGRDNFAKLAYLRALQSCPLSIYRHEALLIYHRAQAEVVSKSLWHAHSTAEIQFEFIPGSHRNWESVILNTMPLLRKELETLDAREEAAV